MMDPEKATALHRYYDSCRHVSEIRDRGLLDRELTAHYMLGTSALNSGSSYDELSAIEAIAGCDWAPEWAKERYTSEH